MIRTLILLLTVFAFLSSDTYAQTVEPRTQSGSVAWSVALHQPTSADDLSLALLPVAQMTLSFQQIPSALPTPPATHHRIRTLLVILGITIVAVILAAIYLGHLN